MKRASVGIENLSEMCCTFWNIFSGRFLQGTVERLYQEWTFFLCCKQTAVAGADPGFLERGFMCIEVCVWGGGGGGGGCFADFEYPMKMK